MKDILLAITIGFTLLTNVYSQDKRVDQLLEKNWKVSCTNVAGYIGYKTQLDLKLAKQEKMRIEWEIKYKEHSAALQANGERINYFRDTVLHTHDKEVAIINREVNILKAKIEVLKLNYFKQNRVSIETFLKKNPTFQVKSSHSY